MSHVNSISIRSTCSHVCDLTSFCTAVTYRHRTHCGCQRSACQSAISVCAAVCSFHIITCFSCCNGSNRIRTQCNAVIYAGFSFITDCSAVRISCIRISTDSCREVTCCRSTYTSCCCIIACSTCIIVVRIGRCAFSTEEIRLRRFYSLFYRMVCAVLDIKIRRFICGTVCFIARISRTCKGLCQVTVYKFQLFYICCISIVFTACYVDNTTFRTYVTYCNYTVCNIVILLVSESRVTINQGTSYFRTCTQCQGVIGFCNSVCTDSHGIGTCNSSTKTDCCRISIVCFCLLTDCNRTIFRGISCTTKSKCIGAQGFCITA